MDPFELNDQTCRSTTSNDNILVKMSGHTPTIVKTTIQKILN